MDAVGLDSALKSAVLIANPVENSEATTASNFWRGRMTLQSSFGENFGFSVAYEQRALISSEPLSGSQALLPQYAALPYQVQPISAALADESHFSWRHALDRAALTIRGDWGRAVLGRQAIGFGRSNFFSVVDVLAPFGTFQVDQEWKSGIDAFDIEWQLTPDWSVGFTEAAEHDFEQGAFLARTTYNWGAADLLVLGGKRSEDWMLATASSWALLDAEFHAELGAFVTDGNGLSHAQVGETTALKATLGGSYSFDFLSGLILLGEYHFNGFGLKDIEDEQQIFLDLDFVRRLQRGDFQTVGQHEWAASANLTISEFIRTYGYAVVSGQDGSGLFAAGAGYDASDVFSIDLSGFIPWGKGGQNVGPYRLLRSEYGETPTTLYLSMRFYD